MINASDIEIFMLDLINAARLDEGLDPLTLERNLNEAAEDYSALLLEEGHFDHEGPDGSIPAERIEEADYDFGTAWGVAENLHARTRGAGSLEDDVTLAFESLMNSSGHRANILNPNYTHVGLGIEVAAYDPFSGQLTVMVTQNFGYSNGIADVQLPGSDASDTLTGGDGDDVLEGLKGDDVLEGGNGVDSIVGGPGDDTIDAGGGNDRVRGSNGADDVLLGDGKDRFFDSDQGGAAGADTVDGGAGKDTLLGGGGNDHFSGGSGADEISGGRGNDLLFGDAGGDTISGDDGGDIISGGDGKDSLGGDAGKDTLDGGAGRDTLSGGTGKDVLTGGSGLDVFVFVENGGQDSVTDFQIGKDRLDVSAWSGVAGLSDLVLDIDGSDAIIRAGSESLVLLGTASTELSASDFLF